MHRAGSACGRLFYQLSWEENTASSRKPVQILPNNGGIPSSCFPWTLAYFCHRSDVFHIHLLYQMGVCSFELFHVSGCLQGLTQRPARSRAYRHLDRVKESNEKYL